MSSDRFLLDTNVLSSLRRPRSSPSAHRFIQTQPVEFLYISALTVGELRRGVVLLKDREPERTVAISAWIDVVLTQYAPRILPVDLDVATRWGNLEVRRTLPVIDSLLAATALVHDLTLVTRNTRDVADTGVRLFNPWA